MKKTTPTTKSSSVHNQRAEDKISNEMAAHFEDHVTASSLVRWITKISQTKRLTPCGHIDDFITNIGWSFLPELINCKDSKSRLLFLESSLPGVFTNCSAIGSKRALCEIGRNYLNEFETLSNDSKEIDDFMKVYSAFLYLLSLFSEYEFMKREREEEQ